MTELSELIEDQSKDAASDYVPYDNLKGSGLTVIAVEPSKLVNLADSLQKVASHKISWGKPAEILQAKRDRQCPRCGRRKNEKNQEPFDISKWGARCPNITVSRDYRHISDFTF